MEHSHEVPPAPRYALQRFHREDDHPLVCEENVSPSFQQLSCALQLRDTGDLQPLELALFLQDVACYFHPYR
jgi:hypothetical protein